MNDRPGKHMDDEAIARGIGSLPDVEADPAFRERLRSAFVSGEISPEEEPRGVSLRPRGGGLRWWQWLVPATAVAAVALILVALNPGAALRVLEAPADGYVRVDGTPIQFIDRARLDEALVAGAEVSVPPGSNLDLIADETAVYEIAGGTRLTLPGTPGRWFARAAECSLFSGEIRMKTGARFAGATLHIYTPDGMAVVAGTLLSVQCDENGTCVCVLDGTASVGVNAESLEAVPPGSRKIMLRDGTVEIVPVKPMHRDGVLDFDARVGDRMNR